ncbi:MAG: energy transducer TonB [Nitrospinae bacterium]|nr:energy transducer TonB [Nitrospinota bacterium]
MAGQWKIGRFIVFSLLLHAVVATMSLNISAIPSLPDVGIIKVTFMDETAVKSEPVVEEKDLEYGKMLDLPKSEARSEVKEKEKAEALSFSSASFTKKGTERSKSGRMTKSSQIIGAETAVPSFIKESPTPTASNVAARSPAMSGEDIDKFAATNPGGELETETEIIIPLNTRKFEYVEYFVAVRGAVASAWNYPEEAIKKGLGGRTVVRMTIGKNGELLEAKVITSAGDVSLDSSALVAVMKSAPFAGFPKGLNKERIHVVATFDYSPQYGTAQ